MTKKEIEKAYRDHDVHMKNFFASIEPKQRAILIEGLGEAIGMLNARMTEEAIHHLRKMMEYLAR
ncbi:hypothetical protein KKE60_05520 [Patescibacteria group bacterium]|nr:hypothetical protein [Patescibacteria group bacterium]